MTNGLEQLDWAFNIAGYQVDDSLSYVVHRDNGLKQFHIDGFNKDGDLALTLHGYQLQHDPGAVVADVRSNYGAYVTIPSVPGTVVVPEPSMGLLGFALCMTALLRRRRSMHRHG